MDDLIEGRKSKWQTWVTTHIATVMRDVTVEKQSVYDVEKMKNIITELFSALEKLRSLSHEIRGPLHDMVKKINEEQNRSGRDVENWALLLNTLLTELDISWIEYANIRDLIKKHEAKLR